MNRVLHTDELIVGNDGSFHNAHNEHHYSVQNPHCLKIGHVQGWWTIAVWAGILYDRVIGPFFFEGGHVTGETYRDFLRNHLEGLLVDIPQEVRQNMWFQQDGHPAHTAVETRALLNEMFPQRWIGLRGQVQEWSPRSPDLAECDFYLWGMLKGKLFPPRPANSEELKQKVRDIFRAVPPDEIARVHENMMRRIGLCLRQDWGHFEHVM